MVADLSALVWSLASLHGFARAVDTSYFSKTIKSFAAYSWLIQNVVSEAILKIPNFVANLFPCVPTKKQSTDVTPRASHLAARPMTESGSSQVQSLASLSLNRPNSRGTSRGTGVPIADSRASLVSLTAFGQHNGGPDVRSVGRPPTIRNASTPPRMGTNRVLSTNVPDAGPPPNHAIPRVPYDEHAYSAILARVDPQLGDFKLKDMAKDLGVLDHRLGGGNQGLPSLVGETDAEKKRIITQLCSDWSPDRKAQLFEAVKIYENNPK